MSTIKGLQAFLTIIVFLLSNATMAGEKAHQANVDKSGLILKGYDPVSYFKSSHPQKGDAKFQTSYKGAVYYFVNNENKEEFLKAPNKYAPQFKGWCAYAVADSKSKVDIDPENYLVQDGRLLLFYKGFWGDTRKKWKKDPAGFLKTADKNWPEVKNKEP